MSLRYGERSARSIVPSESQPRRPATTSLCGSGRRDFRMSNASIRPIRFLRGSMTPMNRMYGVVSSSPIVCAQRREPLRVGHRLEDRVDAARDHGHPLRRHAQQADHVVAGVLGVGHHVVGALHRARHRPLQVGAQARVGALRVEQEGQIVHGQDRAGGPHRRQHEVRRVEQVDRPGQPVGRDRHLEAVPEMFSPALVDAQDPRGSTFEPLG